MWSIIKSLFFKKNRYYIKIRLNNKDVVLSGLSDILSLCDGEPNEVIVATLSGDVQIVIGEK